MFVSLLPPGEERRVSAGGHGHRARPRPRARHRGQRAAAAAPARGQSPLAEAAGARTHPAPAVLRPQTVEAGGQPRLGEVAGPQCSRLGGRSRQLSGQRGECRSLECRGGGGVGELGRGLHVRHGAYLLGYSLGLLVRGGWRFSEIIVDGLRKGP